MLGYVNILFYGQLNIIKNTSIKFNYNIIKSLIKKIKDITCKLCVNVGTVNNLIMLLLWNFFCWLNKILARGVVNLTSVAPFTKTFRKHWIKFVIFVDYVNSKVNANVLLILN